MFSRKREMERDEFSIDLLIDVLSLLPVKSLIRFTSTCKLWCCLIYHPYFIEQHLRRSKAKPTGFLMKRDNRPALPDFQVMLPYTLCFYQENEEPIEVWQPHEVVGGGCFSVMSSCNGLVCVADPSVCFLICICNPATREHIRLLDPFPVHTLDIGLAYDTTTKEYKAFRIFSRLPSNVEESQYEVFTMGSNEWRRKGPVPYYFNLCKHIQVGGALHWITGRDLYNYFLLSIDISGEGYRGRLLPEAPLLSIISQTLLELNGDLCLCVMTVFRLDVWVLTDSEKSVWEKKRSIFVFGWLATRQKSAHALSRNGDEILLELENCQLVHFNVRNMTARRVDTSLVGESWARLDVFEHIETLVPCKFCLAAVRWPEIMELLDDIFPEYKQEEFRINLELKL